MTNQTNSFPIHQVVGIGNDPLFGISVIYEKDDGTAGFYRIWGEEWDKISFSDTENKIIFKKMKKGIFAKETWQVEKVLLRRSKLIQDQDMVLSE